MKTSWILTVLISLLLAAGAALYANNMLNERLAAVAADEVELVPVVAAAVEIPAGTTVEAQHLKTVGIPRDAKPEASYEDLADLVGHTAKQTVYPGEIIVSERFETAPGSSALTALIPPGKRAITVAVNNVVGVSGFILPGSRVDVISTSRGSPETILENIKVLAVDQLINQDKKDPVSVSAVTLEVTPVQAEVIVKARGLRLTLRNPEDGVVVAAAEPTQEPTEEESQEASPAPSQTEQYVSVYVVDIVRGTAVSSTRLNW